ncbi:MAG: EFR1 family ferrodoxin [Spirochaetes bacterium]|nr:EFR1 family ferrodoxin [Spirochaetota bacterium]
MKIDICYFSSTGNTYWLTQKAKEIWEKIGHEVAVYEVIKEGKNFARDCDMCGFIYPVWESQIPQPFRDLLMKMPKGVNKDFFLIGNCALFTGDTGLYWKKRIDQQGYNVFYANHVIMPVNCSIPYWNFIKVPHETKLEKMKSKALNKLKIMCIEIIRKKQKIVGYSSFSRFFGQLQRKVFEEWDVLALFKKMIMVDSTRCNGCQKCMKMCPTGNLVKNEKNEIHYLDHCIGCLRCYNLCPETAIHLSQRTYNLKRYPRYKGPAGEYLPTFYR